MSLPPKREGETLNAFLYSARDDKIVFSYQDALRANREYMKAKGYRCPKCRCGYGSATMKGYAARQTARSITCAVT